MSATRRGPKMRRTTSMSFPKTEDVDLMPSRTAKALVAAALAGTTLSIASPAGARLTWIVRQDGSTIGTEAGSSRPCQVVPTAGGADHELLGADLCWVVLPQPVA